MNNNVAKPNNVTRALYQITFRNYKHASSIYMAQMICQRFKTLWSISLEFPLVVAYRQAVISAQKNIVNEYIPIAFVN